ncbi:RidA family protein [Planctomicrobium sp. SH661]|uniref:RidA family protein n=1 Tax=Planctomicrobium sp. SH661 TaxID=3448124 RepID=UPI003F5C22B5
MPFQPILGDSPRSHLPFSPAVQAGPFFFVSGQASVDDEGAIVSDSFEGEFRRSFRNIERILQNAGLSLKDVVKVNSYVDHAGNLAEYNRLYREIFSAPFPARTTLVGCLDGTNLKYEVDVIAYQE